MNTQLLANIEYAKWSIGFFLLYTLLLSVLVEFLTFVNSGSMMTMLTQILYSKTLNYFFVALLVLGSVSGAVAMVHRKNMSYAVMGFLLNAITLWGFVRGFFDFN